MEGRYVLVTTEFRGVFFGKFVKEERNEHGLRIELENARTCISWSSDVKGFLGLATNGPTKGCRIGPAVSHLSLEKVTSFTTCSDEAVTEWEKAPWG